MHLIVGLGNPGDEYKSTRHNIGFLCLDFLAQKHALHFSASKWNADVVKGRMWGESCILLKPLTYMNRSGLAVVQASQYYRISQENIIVFHDDLDLPLGRMKMVFDRGAGGHNGVRSMIEQLGSKRFARIRIGIGRPVVAQGASSYVLSRFDNDELAVLHEKFNFLEEGLQCFIKKGPHEAMNMINSEK